MKNLTFGIMGFLVVILTNNGCFGATIYVDQSGGGDYTTVEAGINAAFPGDTVKVGPGVYQVTVTINKDINLMGSGPKYTTIQASSDGIILTAGINTEITNFTITSGGYGINASGNNITCTVRNCVIVGCGSSGIYYRKGDPYFTVTNNTIAYNGGDGLYIHDQYSDGKGYINIQGNIIVYNEGDGLDLYSDGHNYENISCNNVFANAVDYNPDTLKRPSDISFDPLFIDKNAGNYALQSTSHCIDSGIPGESFNDPDGTRNDMGAFSGPPSAAFWPYISRGPAVTEITLTPASVPRGGTITIQAKGRVQ